MNQKTKKSNVAGYFYPKNKNELKTQLDLFFKNANNSYNGEQIKALIVPHAGYIYSGQIAMEAYKKLYYYLSLDTHEKYKIIILAPSHHVYLKQIATMSYVNYNTPFGNVKLSKHKLQKYIHDEAFAKEHSVEVQLPYLQYIFKKAKKQFEVLPVLVGECDTKEISKIIETEINENTIIIASSDLSHYLEYNQAIKTDKETIQNIMHGKNEIDACGKYPILILNQIYKCKKQLLKYTNSGEVTRDYSGVVGYASFCYFDKEKNILIMIAKKSIYNEINNKIDDFQEIKKTISEEYKQKQGVFVTLTINGELRGCIGEIYGHYSVVDSVIINSKNAAFYDPRFYPLTKQEFEKIEIEISILSEPKDCKLEDIKKGDGVILITEISSAIYLPQVWEHFNTKQEFLESLCEKAMLNSDCYKNQKTKFKTFSVKIIKE